MISPTAIGLFTHRQRALVHDAYDQAWQRGVQGYEPDEDPEEPTPEHHHAGEEASLTGALLLQARAQRAYQPPTGPDMGRRQRALAGALRSTEAMATELATLSPTPEQFDQARQEADAGRITPESVTTAALLAAVADWAESNAYRLDAGASVAWAAEQAGYAEAADQDGQLLQWDGEDDDRMCGDCQGLEELGPQPLEEFPCMPGEGATACDVGCRCSLSAVGTLEPGDTAAPLTDEENASVGKIAEQAQERMDQLAPNFAMAA